MSTFLALAPLSLKLMQVYIVTIPVRKLLVEEFLLNRAKDLFRWGTEAILTRCSS